MLLNNYNIVPTTVIITLKSIYKFIEDDFLSFLLDITNCVVLFKRVTFDPQATRRAAIYTPISHFNVNIGTLLEQACGTWLRIILCILCKYIMKPKKKNLVFDYNRVLNF